MRNRIFVHTVVLWHSSDTVSSDAIVILVDYAEDDERPSLPCSHGIRTVFAHAPVHHRTDINFF